MRKKERLYISEIVNEPFLTYPTYYNISHSLRENEIFISTLIDLHLLRFDMYKMPEDGSDIFNSLMGGSFAIYKESYCVGYFGTKLMYLEPSGWKSMQLTKDIFDMNEWLISL